MLNCQLVSFKNREEIKFVRSLTLPAFNGEVQILPRHAECFLLLKSGKVLINTGEETREFQIKSGFCFLRNDQVIILYDA